MKNNGFTLIELVVVIVIFGVLAVTAAPRFLNITTDSHVAVVQGTGASLKVGVNFAYAKIMATNGGGPATNIPIYDDSATGQLDFNEWGYPAQQWRLAEALPRLDNVADCISVWTALFVDPPTVSESSDANDSDYRAEYIALDQCRYYYNIIPELSIYYNSVNGDVTVDDDPNS